MPSSAVHAVLKTLLFVTFALSLVACGQSSTPTDPTDAAGAATRAPSGLDAGQTGDAAASGPADFGNSDLGRPNPRDAAVMQAEAPADECGEVSARADLQPVHLAFVFDVSGSMGNLDHPWYDPTLKWAPVVAATRTFLEREGTVGLNASLTFFPNVGSDENTPEKCEDATYATPDVPMTALPSDAFGVAIEDIETSGWWGYGTPTLQALNGAITYVSGLANDEPGVYAIVLVTDGYPEGCPSSEIDNAVTAVAAVSDAIPTYVIGVANPPIEDAPDVVGNLNAIAEAGGGAPGAFLVDTGDPTQTTAELSSVIDQIRGASLPCEARIPAPPDDRSFDKQAVTVTYSGGGGTMQLRYDANCAGGGAWHYDDPATPSGIVLCPATCDILRADLDGELSFEFGCEQVIEIPE